MKRVVSLGLSRVVLVAAFVCIAAAVGILGSGVLSASRADVGSAPSGVTGPVGAAGASSAAPPKIVLAAPGATGSIGLSVGAAGKP